MKVNIVMNIPGSSSEEMATGGGIGHTLYSYRICVYRGVHEKYYQLGSLVIPKVTNDNVPEGVMNHHRKLQWQYCCGSLGGPRKGILRIFGFQRL